MRVRTGIQRRGALALALVAFSAARADDSAPREPSPPPLYYRIRSPWLDPAVVEGPVRPQETSHALAALEVTAINLGIWGFDKITKKPYANISLDTWQNNLRKGWIVDTDDFWMNGLLHPVQGQFSYAAARSLGVGFYGSFGYTFAASLLWEYFGETQAPSVNDQINTPFGGALFGEAMFRFHHLILDAGGPNPGVLRRLLAFFASPVAGANELLFQDHYRGPLILPVSWIGEFSLGAVLTAQAKDDRTGELRTGLGPWALFEAHILYGVPGTPGLRLDRPFDHFSLDMSLSGTPSGVEPALSFLIRGVLTGKTIGPDDDSLGFWGLYATYDFFAAQPFRVTGFGLGPGVAVVKRWGWFDLYPTALVELVPWGGAGLVQPLGARDYLYGIGAEGLLALRMDFGSHVTIRTSVREFLVTDSHLRGRSEADTYWRVAVIGRIWGPHALALESAWSRRDAQTDAGPLLQRGWSLSAKYTLLSGW